VRYRVERKRVKRKRVKRRAIGKARPGLYSKRKKEENEQDALKAKG